MKQIKLTLAIFSALLLGGVATSFAQQTAYMCSDVNIMFSATPGSVSSPIYVWSITDGTTTDTIDAGDPGIAFENGGGTLKVTGASSDLFVNSSTTAFREVTINVAIAEGEEGCYSPAGAYTVNILPKPAVTLSDVTNYCADNPNSGATLTATTTGTLTLPSGVAADGFAWTLDGAAVSSGVGAATSPEAGQWQSVLTYTSPSNTTTVQYGVTVAYTLPEGYTLIGGCTSDAATADVTSYATPSAPSLNTAAGF